MVGFSANGDRSNSSSDSKVMVGEPMNGFEGESRIKRGALRGGVENAGEGVNGGCAVMATVRVGVLGASSGRITDAGDFIRLLRLDWGGETCVYVDPVDFPTPQNISSSSLGSPMRRLLGVRSNSSSSEVVSRSPRACLRLLFLCVVLGGVGNEATLVVDALLLRRLRCVDIAVFSGGE